jgi:hypothetical protein
MSVGLRSEERVNESGAYATDAGGNMSGQTFSGTNSGELLNMYEAIFGPSGRDIRSDSQRNKRHQRWHLPDALKGYNAYLNDRVDGLITDATNSPFTKVILPYVYMENPDQKIKWNVYSFDEGLASRVPYESAARVLTQTKSSHAGYAVRHGLAIKMEHNFLASAAGLQNFQRQLTQLVGSIQLTNNLDVHIALLQAPSYQKTIDEKYYDHNRTLHRAGKTFCDMFGIMQKIPNALDIIIEDARNHLNTWGSPPPTFLLCPSSLTAQLTMLPERTEYLTNGPAGPARLAKGPDLPSYRGLSIIHSQKFELEKGRVPRNILKRRVRVAEYYWIYEAHPHASISMYNQKMDSMESFTRKALIQSSNIMQMFSVEIAANANVQKALNRAPMMLLRANIEHEMLGVIVGRGGTQELGATFWGQTELSCYDDAQHGLWGMSYKYHERAMVTNERNMIRMFDIAFDGYIGGMDSDVMRWTEDGAADLLKSTYDVDVPFSGSSVVVLLFPKFKPPQERFTGHPSFGLVFTERMNAIYDEPLQQVWNNIDLMYSLHADILEPMIVLFKELHEGLMTIDVDQVNRVLASAHERPLTQAEITPPALTEFVGDMLLMLESHCITYVVPNPIVLATVLSSSHVPVFLDAEKNQNITDAREHSFVETFRSKYTNPFTTDVCKKYDDALGHAWREEQVTSAATHIQNNTVDIPSLAYHGNLVVQPPRDAGAANNPSLPREVKCVGHMGNSYPGVASIREGRGRIFQPMDTRSVHIM